MPDNKRAGVATGDAAWALLAHAKANGYILPVVDCASSAACNAALAAAAASGNLPLVIRFSEEGAAAFAGPTLGNASREASVLGAVAGAHHVRLVAPAYGVTVLVQSGQCAKPALAWLDGMLEADKAYFAAHGEPLFSSHALDLATTDDEGASSAEYCKKMAHMGLVIEAGVAGGGDEEAYACHVMLRSVSDRFVLAAPLQPVEQLGSMQRYAEGRLGGASQPLCFACHGAGAATQDVEAAIAHGVVTMSVDTDAEWARLREAEAAMRQRVEAACRAWRATP